MDIGNPALAVDCPKCGLLTPRFLPYCRNCAFSLWPSGEANISGKIVTTLKFNMKACNTDEGAVRPNIRVTKTTGYPQLDQLGIDALKQWQFAPLNSPDADQGQWGIITFNFSLSS